MKNTLVIGPSGSGKTYIVNTLKAEVENVFDADEIANLSEWVDGKGQEVKFPKNADKDWLDNHEFLWKRSELIKFLSKHAPAIIFGLSGNIFKMIDLFDGVFYLDVPRDILLERLQHSSRENPFGKTEEQRLLAAKFNEELRVKAQKLNIPFIDATQEPRQILEIIRSAGSRL